MVLVVTPRCLKHCHVDVLIDNVNVNVCDCTTETDSECECVIMFDVDADVVMKLLPTRRSRR